MTGKIDPRTLGNREEWEAFFAVRAESGHMTEAGLRRLRSFIDGERYLSRVAAAEKEDTDAFPGVPTKKLLHKQGTAKKRTVYIYPYEERLMLKLLARLTAEKYDRLLPDVLYSFRARRGTVAALGRLLRLPGMGRKYTYKADISDYFNSIPPERMLCRLRPVLEAGGDDWLYAFFERVLTDRRVRENGQLTEVQTGKGVMAGAPFSGFLANLYLTEMDREFERGGLIYARYSDDIILFADTEAERDAAARRVREILAENGLRINPKKEVLTAPDEPWTFLGLCFDGKTVDIAPASFEKLKKKIRRKARAMKRWQVKKKLPPDRAARGFIKKMNRKFFDAEDKHELTWARWYFPVISTDTTLKQIDACVQDWARALATDTHGTRKYACTYADLKAMGYRSLVHEWYAYRGGEKAEGEKYNNEKNQRTV